MDVVAKSGEVELLLAVARGCASEPREPSVPRDLDWDKFFALAAAHGLRPHACRYLRGQCPVHWRAWFEANARHNLALTAELARVVRLLAEGGVQAVPFKGPLLAAQAYGEVALRECSDLDLVLRPADFPKAKTLLLQSGYRPCRMLSAAQESAHLRSGCELNFASADGMCLDVQWRPAPAHFCIELPQSVWSRLQACDPGLGALPTFAAEDLLPLLCIHGAKHLWRRLIWICDVGALARMPGLDWDVLLDRAAEMRARRMVLLGLYLAAELLHAPLPDGVAERANKLRGSAMRVCRDLFRGGDPTSVTPADHWFVAGLQDCWRDRARYFTRLAFTPAIADWEDASRFYVFARMARLTRKFVAAQQASGKRVI